MKTMFKQYVLIFVLELFIRRTNTSTCSFQTTCQCLITNDLFSLNNCSYSLPDLPIINRNLSLNLTKLIATNALIQWPKNLCKYSNIVQLDLSYSLFADQSIEMLCLHRLTHLNLSFTQLKTIPNLQTSLEFIDLSNNQIEIIRGQSFRLLTHLKQLSMQNNPLKRIDHFEYLLHLNSINLISSTPNLIIEKPLSVNQWIHLATKWKLTNQSLTIQTNTIAFQSLFPRQIQLISNENLEIIFRTLANSTFTTLVSTPECNCFDLGIYQEILKDNLIESPLYQSTTCLMPNGIIHAKLFDRHILFDLHCIRIHKKSRNQSSRINDNFVLVCFICFFRLFLLIEK